MNDFMTKERYDLTEITRLLLEMRENCIPKAGDAYEDPNRAEKYDALNAAIDLINNPSMISRWISVKDRLPDEGDIYLVVVKEKHDYESQWNYHVDAASNYGDYIDDYWDTFNDWNEGQEVHVTHWMPLPELPKGEEE